VKLEGVLDFKFELLRTIHSGVVAVAEWYNFRIPTDPTRFNPTRGRADHESAETAAVVCRRRGRAGAHSGRWHHRRPRWSREEGQRGHCADPTVKASPLLCGTGPRGLSRAHWAIESQKMTTVWHKPVIKVPVVQPRSFPQLQAATCANSCGTRSKST